MASEIQPTPRQISPLPWEMEIQQVQSAADRHEWLLEWNTYVPVSRGTTYPQAFTTPERKTSANEESLGSIYIPRPIPKSFPFYRRSTRIIRKLNSLGPPPSSPYPHFQTPLGTYYTSSYTPTPQQSAEIVVPCPEVEAVYCISRENFKIERRRRRIFERDFPRYNKALRYRDIQEFNREDFGTTDWERVISTQADYQPSLRPDKSPTPGFTTEESDLEPCSGTELFGYTVKPSSQPLPP